MHNFTVILAIKHGHFIINKAPSKGLQHGKKIYPCFFGVQFMKHFLLLSLDVVVTVVVVAVVAAVAVVVGV